MVDPPVVTAAGEHKRKAEDEADGHRDKAPAVAATAEDAPTTAPQTKPAPFTTGFAGFASASSGFGAAAAGTGGFAGFASVAAGSGFGGFGKGTGDAPVLASAGFGSAKPLGSKPGFGGAPDGSEGEGDGDGDDDVVAAPAPEYKPLVTLPEAPRVTGEEDEETVFSAPAALFAFEAPEAGRPPTWRERGKGELRVNCAREGTRARMVMRSAGNLRLILNAVLFTAMHVSIMDGGKGVTFSCANAAEGSVRQEKEAQPDGDGGKEAGEDGQPTAEVHMFAVRLRSADAEARVFELKSAIESALAAQSSRGKEEGEAPHEV